MSAEGGREPFWGSVNGARLADVFLSATLGFGRAAIVEPLAAVVIAEHVRSGFDTHAGLTASGAPSCIRDH